MQKELPRKLGMWTAMAVLIGSSIGSGIFRSPAGIAERVPGVVPFMGIWVAGGLLALCGALTLAEIGGAYPETGGFYVYLREGWGKLAAFLFGWAELLLIRATALAAMAITFAEYFVRAFGQDPRIEPYDTYARIIAGAAIIALWTLNYRGIRGVARLQNITTAAKYGALVFMVLVAAAAALSNGGTLHGPVFPAESVSVARYGLALISVMWVYDGWGDVSFVSGEIENPRRVLPRVFIGGTVALIVIYLATNLAYLSVLPVGEMPGSKLVAADVMSRLLGAAGVTFIAFTVVVSTFGSINGSLFTGPRILFAMAQDRLLFRQIGFVHPRFATPYVAVSVISAVALAAVLIGKFEQLADAFVTSIIPFYALGVAAIFRLRKRDNYDPPFRVPGYPVVPMLFIVTVIAMLVSALSDPSTRFGTSIVFGVLLLGIPVYYMMGRRTPE
jgi:basic amino acid/polyamine antiporter, APA family